METIKFKKQIYDHGTIKMLEAEGIPYTTKDGLKVALHKENDGWCATELSTGKLCTIDGKPTLSAAKSEVEKNSPTVLKILKKIQPVNQQIKPARSIKAIKKLAKPTKERKEQKMKRKTSPSTQKQKAPRPNPFAGADDIYATKNKIAVTTTINRKTKRGFSKLTKTKYYEQNSTNARLLRKANRNTVRVGRTGTTFKQF